MYEHLRRKFPRHTSAIQSTVNKDPVARSLFDDYEELSTWMAVQSREKSADVNELENAKALQRDLETEILNRLGDPDDYGR